MARFGAEYSIPPSKTRLSNCHALGPLLLIPIALGRLEENTPCPKRAQADAVRRCIDRRSGSPPVEENVAERDQIDGSSEFFNFSSTMAGRVSQFAELASLVFCQINRMALES